MLFLGILLIILGFLVIIFSLISSGKGETKFAIVGFLGPIPFGFGNDRALVIGLLIFAIILLLVIAFLFRSI